MINKKILVAASCVVALLVGCKSGGDETAGNKLPYGPATSNITITKENLPVEAKVCSDEDTFYLDADSAVIGDNGYIMINTNISKTSEKKDCSLSPFIISNDMHNVSIHFDCSKTEQKQNQDEAGFISRDGAKILFSQECVNIADDSNSVNHIFIKSSNRLLDLNTLKNIPNSSDWNGISGNFDFLGSYSDDSHQNKLYNINTQSLSSTFIDKVSTKEINVQNSGLITDDGISLIALDDKLYFCHFTNGLCDSLSINIYQSNGKLANSNNGAYTYYATRKSELDPIKLNVITSDMKTIENISLIPDTDFVSVTEGGILLLSDYNSNVMIYSYKYNKMVDIIDVIKALKLETKLTNDGKFYGNVNMSANGKFLLFLFGKNDSWIANGITKEIDRVYIPQGIDELVKTLPAKQV
jgi:hypothetical protein